MEILLGDIKFRSTYFLEYFQYALTIVLFDIQHTYRSDQCQGNIRLFLFSGQFVCKKLNGLKLGQQSTQRALLILARNMCEGATDSTNYNAIVTDLLRTVSHNLWLCIAPN